MQHPSSRTTIEDETGGPCGDAGFVIGAPLRLYGECADLDALNARVEAKLIARKDHPIIPSVTLYNYTPRAQFERAWDEHVLQARGLIVDSKTGEIIARPWPKFFNYDEVQVPLPWDEPFDVTTKMDGSLFIATRSRGDLITATRGSFESTQAVWGRQLLGKYAAEMREGVTYLFELIHPENRIVVDYGDRRELVLLSMIQSSTGRELPLVYGGVSVVEHHLFVGGIRDGAGLLDLETSNAEGFVVRFRDGRRVKVKFAEYRRLHKLVTGVSTKTIWEALRDGISLDEMLERVPDEFNEFVRSTIAELREKFEDMESVGRELAESVRHLPTRKEQAAIVSRHPCSAVAFAVLDGKDYAPRIWRAIEPEYRQPFASRDAA